MDWKNHKNDRNVLKRIGWRRYGKRDKKDREKDTKRIG